MARGTVQVNADAAASFAALARDLRRAGAGGLTKELQKGLQRSARPAIEAVRESALATLPRRGGLAARVAGSNITVRAYSGRGAAIKFRATGKGKGHSRKGTGGFDARAMDAGQVRHPVFGVWRRKMAAQPVPPGFFNNPLTGQAPAFRKALLDAVDAVERDITG